MRVYLDTSMFGGCFDQEFEIWSNHLIALVKVGHYKAVISEVSEFELQFAPKHVKDILNSIPANNIEIAELTDEAKHLAELYIKEKIVTKK